MNKFLLPGLLSLLLLGCSSKQTGVPRYLSIDRIEDVPIEIYAKAVEPLMDCFGSDYLENHSMFVGATVTNNRMFGTTSYSLRWSVQFLQDASETKTSVVVHVNADGTVHPDTLQFPKCRLFPELCDIKISRERALEIAKEVGHEKDESSWTVTFAIRDDRFVWCALNVTRILDDHGEGRMYDIDACTGEIVTDREVMID
jgi:hypothetical protein